MKTKNLTLYALFFALALVLSFVENQFTVIPSLPGVKLGLSNVVVMFFLFAKGVKAALSLNLLKSVFALITRGVVAGALSLAGGVISVLLMCILMKLLKENSSVAMISISGAMVHNIAQFTVVSFIYGSVSMLPYLPIIIVSGIVFGLISGAVTKAVMPVILKRTGDK